MNWAAALSRVYDIAVQKGEPVLPLFHSTANAQIELTLSENGDFKNAVLIEKKDAVTVIPVTEDSQARGSSVSPMPFEDNLTYLAEDCDTYSKKSYIERYKAYKEQLFAWKSGAFSHPALFPVYTYISKGCLMHDLIEAEILHLDEDGKLDGTKYEEVEQEKLFVRFVIEYSDSTMESRTWLDASLQKKFQEYMMDKIGHSEKQLCYATGEMLYPTYKHPNKIRNAGDGGRLISANDESGLIYRGRFADKTQAVSVGYFPSQKIHAALKFLISKQRSYIDTLNFVTWASELQEIPLVLSSRFRIDAENKSCKTLEEYEAWLKVRMDEYRKNMNPETKVMILAVDSCSTGRTPITYYDEIPADEYLNNVYTWCRNSAWKYYNYETEEMSVKAYTPYDYIRAAYGFEQKTGLSYETKSLYSLAGIQIMNLIPCITRGKPVSEYLEKTLWWNASNINAYEKKYNHYILMYTLCSIYRLRKKGNVAMGYDPKETDRSYLYGCLLAIADKAEIDTYPERERGKAVSNARRYWTEFAKRPYQTWQKVEEKLRPYLNRHPYRISVEKQMNEIMSKFSAEDFKNNKKLGPMYLLGYHHYKEYMYRTHESNEEEFENE